MLTPHVFAYLLHSTVTSRTAPTTIFVLPTINLHLWIHELELITMDTGRIRMENYNGVLYCEAYMNDEFTLSDLEAMRDEIRKNYNSVSNVILRKAGSYSVSVEAQITLSRGVKEFHNFIYVADDSRKRESAEFAAENYMKSYNTRVARTKEQAYAMLTED